MYKALLSSVILFISLHANAEILLTAKEDILIKPKATSTAIGGACVMNHDSSAKPRYLRQDSIITVTLAENVRPFLRDAAVDFGASLQQASAIETYEQLLLLGNSLGASVPSPESLLNNSHEFGTLAAAAINDVAEAKDFKAPKNYAELKDLLLSLGGEIPSAKQVIEIYTKLFISGKSKQSTKLISVTCAPSSLTLEESLEDLEIDTALSVTNGPDDL